MCIYCLQFHHSYDFSSSKADTCFKSRLKMRLKMRLKRAFSVFGIFTVWILEWEYVKTDGISYEFTHSLSLRKDLAETHRYRISHTFLSESWLFLTSLLCCWCPVVSCGLWLLLSSVLLIDTQMGNSRLQPNQQLHFLESVNKLSIRKTH